MIYSIYSQCFCYQCTVVYFMHDSTSGGFRFIISLVRVSLVSFHVCLQVGAVGSLCNHNHLYASNPILFYYYY